MIIITSGHLAETKLDHYPLSRSVAGVTLLNRSASVRTARHSSKWLSFNLLSENADLA
jgi:hypothetical protein